mmetsp:Transcript_42612/g.66746  ORF Transcript_42612/g.66746 Transcript_42612/m.66746 type:complete len:107 (+) Transcript_42612:895-1215(+)
MLTRRRGAGTLTATSVVLLYPASFFRLFNPLVPRPLAAPLDSVLQPHIARAASEDSIAQTSTPQPQGPSKPQILCSNSSLALQQSNPQSPSLEASPSAPQTISLSD